MPITRHWTLGAKLALVAMPFLCLAMASIGVLVWMSLQLEGGAASVNDASGSSTTNNRQSDDGLRNTSARGLAR